MVQYHYSLNYLESRINAPFLIKHPLHAISQHPHHTTTFQTNNQTTMELTYCNDFPETDTSCDRTKTTEIPKTITITHTFLQACPPP